MDDLDDRIRENLLAQSANFNRQKQLLSDMRTGTTEDDDGAYSLNKQGSNSGSFSLLPTPPASATPLDASLLQDEFVAEQESLNVLKQQLGVVQQIRLDHERKEAALKHLQDEVHELREFKAHAEDLSEQLRIAHEACSQRDNELQLVHKQRAELETNLRAQIAILEDTHREQCATSRTNHQQLEALMTSQRIDAEHKLTEFQERTAEYTSKLLSFQRSLEEERTQHSVAASNAARLQESLDCANQEKATLAEKLGHATAENSELKSHNQQLSQEYQAAQSNCKVTENTLKTRSEAFQTDIDHLSGQLQQASVKHAALENAKARAEGLLNQRQREADALSTEVEQLHLAEAELQAQRQEKDKLADTIAQLERDLEKHVNLYQAAVANGMTIKDEVIKLMHLLDSIAPSTYVEATHSNGTLSSLHAQTIANTSTSGHSGSSTLDAADRHSDALEWVAARLSLLHAKTMKVAEDTKSKKLLEVEMNELKQNSMVVQQLLEHREKELEESNSSLAQERTAGQVLSDSHREMEHELQTCKLKVEQLTGTMEMRTQWLGSLVGSLHKAHEMSRDSDVNTSTSSSTGTPHNDPTNSSSFGAEYYEALQWPKLQNILAEKLAKAAAYSMSLQQQLDERDCRLAETKSQLHRITDNADRAAADAACTLAEVRLESENALDRERHRHEVTENSRNTLRAQLDTYDAVIDTHRAEAGTFRRQAKEYLSAVQLLLRYLGPLRIRNAELMQQKKFLSHRLNALEQVKSAMDNLTDAICNDVGDVDLITAISGESDTQGLVSWWGEARRCAKSRSTLFSLSSGSTQTTSARRITFRGAVLAILALNRFLRLAKSPAYHFGVPVSVVSPGADVSILHIAPEIDETNFQQQQLAALLTQLRSNDENEDRIDVDDGRQSSDGSDKEVYDNGDEDLDCVSNAKSVQYQRESKEKEELVHGDNEEEKDDEGKEADTTKNIGWSFKRTNRGSRRRARLNVKSASRPRQTRGRYSLHRAGRGGSNSRSLNRDCDDLMQILNIYWQHVQEQIWTQSRTRSRSRKGKLSRSRMIVVSDPTDPLNWGWGDPRSLFGRIVLCSVRREQAKQVDWGWEKQDDMSAGKAMAVRLVGRRVPIQIEVHLVHKVVLALAKRAKEAEATAHQLQNWATDSLVQQDVHSRQVNAAEAANTKLKELVAFLEVRVKELTEEQMLMVPPDRHDEVKQQKQLLEAELQELQARSDTQLRDLGELKAKAAEAHRMLEKERLYSTRISQAQEQQREELSFSRAYLQRKETEAAQLHSLAQRHTTLQRQLSAVQAELRTETAEKKVIREELDSAMKRAKHAEDQFVKLESSVVASASRIQNNNLKRHIAANGPSHLGQPDTQTEPNESVGNGASGVASLVTNVASVAANGSAFNPAAESPSSTAGAENSATPALHKGTHVKERSMHMNLQQQQPSNSSFSTTVLDRRQELLSLHSQAQSELEDALNQTFLNQLPHKSRHTTGMLSEDKHMQSNYGSCGGGMHFGGAVNGDGDRTSPNFSTAIHSLKDSSMDAYLENLDKKLNKSYGTPHSRRLSQLNDAGKESL